MAVPDGKFTLTQETMQETFVRLNAELFGGQLAAIPLKLSNAVKRGGTYRAKAEFVQQNSRMRRLLRDHRIENLRDESITISKKLCLTQETLDRFMAHEMVHQWQSGVMGVSEDRGGHGDLFHQKMEEINSARGPDFVTLSSDVVAGETGGREGQVYHVVIFERGDRKFGGFSRRPFGEKETGIIEQTAQRMGVEFRVLTTTSHDAQMLLDMSRMRPGTRKRSWAVIPKDIHESIVSGETTIAALRRARLRIADLRGVTLLVPEGVTASLHVAAMEVTASSGTMVAYHATLSGSDIMEGGFKKSDEVSRVGLGGSSTGGSVSFTTDWGVAIGIHKSFVMMHDLVNADDPLAAIAAHFGSLDPGLATKVLEYWKSADGGDLKEMLGGWKPKPYGSSMQTYDQLVRQGFKPVHAAGDEGGEGDTLYYQWLEPVSVADAEKMVYTYVKVYFYSNDEYNPVFMGGDSSHFKGIPRDDIGVFTVELHIDPSKKRKNHGELDRPSGYAILPAESEYRVSDMSMIGKVLDYDAYPGAELKVRGDEVSYHTDQAVETEVNKLLSLLVKHRAILERGGKLDVRQAMAVLRDADDIWAVMEAAGTVLSVAGLRGIEATLRDIIDLSGRMRPSEIAGKAVAALPSRVHKEVSDAPSSAKFSDISEMWYDRDEGGYTAWCDALLKMDIGESAAEREIDDWIYSHHFEDRLQSSIVSARYWIPDFDEGDAEAYMELVTGLERATKAKTASTLKVALRTVFEAGDQSKARHFILRRGKLWLWGSIDLGGDEEARLVESIREEFGTDKPPFDQKFPIDNQYRVRDMFESLSLFGSSSDDDMTKFNEFASDTLFGMVFPDGRLRAKTVAGLPVHADHPEMEKLLKHLGAEMDRPQPKGVWHHGFTATPERMSGVARFGLRPADAVGESNWERNEEYDRSLVYLTTDEMNAKGHATGSEGKYPYAAVVAVQEESLDLVRMEPDFDAERAGFKPGRAAVAGYRGRIPVTNFDWVKIYRNGYNQETTPLLLTLGPDEFSSMAKEYAEWAERTKDDREALDKEQMHPSFIDRKRVQELHERIGTDPIRLAVDAKKKLDIAASLRDARLRMGVLHG